MRNPLWLGLLAILWLFAYGGVASIAQDKYFPTDVLDLDSRSDQRKVEWYSHALRVLKEPSLLKLADETLSESYRFLWLRTFRRPIAIRLDVKPDGTGVLTTKVADGEAGFPYTVQHLVEKVSRSITKEQTQTFLTGAKRVNFWSLPTYLNDPTGTDGSQWIVEGVKEGKYHVVDRWSPREGPIRELGLLLAFDMAQINIPQNDIY